MAALSRIEILKEGAAATYGSDAIAGVVNFITDSNFEGLRVNASVKGIPNAEENVGREFSITYGTQLNDGTNFLLSVGQQKKPELRAQNTDYATQTFANNDVGGWSSIGNPATFIYKDGAPANVAAGLGGAAFMSDPGCNRAGGYQQLLSAPVGTSVEAHKEFGGICRYQYTYFDNVQEEQENSQLWMEFNGDINDHDFHVEFAYGKTNVPNYATSPAYPPNDPNSSAVPNIHPALQALYTQHPDFANALKHSNYFGDGTNQAAAHVVRTRAIGAVGNPYGNSTGAEIEKREYDTYRFAFNFEGELAAGIDYSAGLNYSRSEGTSTFSDTQRGKYYAALFGYGGPNCNFEVQAFGDANATGVAKLAPTLKNLDTGATVVASLTDVARPAGCLWLNPFSNAIEHANQNYYGNNNPLNADDQVGTIIGERVGKNPLYLSDQKNDPALIRYLLDRGQVETQSSLLTVDFTMQGLLGSLGGGDAAWAFGFERREYEMEQSLPSNPGATATNARTNIFDGNLYPCSNPSLNSTKAGRDSCASNPVGLFMFLAPVFARDDSQEVDSLFAEFALPITDTFDMQLALRYEDYGTVDSVDPKVVMRWSPTDDLTLRFTGQTTFRAPHPDETSNVRYTQLSFTNQTGAFKAVDITGNPNLDPEEATTFNIGAITDFGTDNWKATVDYYKFEFDNPIIFENHQQLANAYEESSSKAAVASQIFGPGNVAGNVGSFTAAEIGRIQSNFINGPKTETDGVDVFVQYETDYANGVMSAGVEANYIIGYSVDKYMKGAVMIADAYECAGFFNIENTCRSMPDLKAKAFLNYKTDAHNFYGAVNYVSSYTDRRKTNAGCGKVLNAAGHCTEIAGHTTVDATYTYSWDDQFDFSLSVYNLTDEMPPFTVWEMNYDPNTHSPLGRFIKAGFTYRMQ
jgi:iron complex outermembrane receptor protein